MKPSLPEPEPTNNRWGISVLKSLPPSPRHSREPALQRWPPGPNPGRSPGSRREHSGPAKRTGRSSERSSGHGWRLGSYCRSCEHVRLECDGHSSKWWSSGGGQLPKFWSGHFLIDCFYICGYSPCVTLQVAASCVDTNIYLRHQWGSSGLFSEIMGPLNFRSGPFSHHQRHDSHDTRNLGVFQSIPGGEALWEQLERSKYPDMSPALAGLAESVLFGRKKCRGGWHFWEFRSDVLVTVRYC